MRRFNAIIAMLTLALFVIHGVMGALNLMNVAPLVSKGLSYTILTAFESTEGGVFRLLPFDGARLTAQLLLVASVAVHIITNVKPALIAFGVRRLKPRAGDILFFLSAALLFMAAGFIIYYIRWHS